jgi:hypothetical protein
MRPPVQSGEDGRRRRRTSGLGIALFAGLMAVFTFLWSYEDGARDLLLAFSPIFGAALAAVGMTILIAPGERPIFASRRTRNFGVLVALGGPMAVVFVVGKGPGAAAATVVAVLCGGLAAGFVVISWITSPRRGGGWFARLGAWQMQGMLCPHCGMPNKVQSKRCPYCGREIPLSA